jgi:hypothetical protein
MTRFALIQTSSLALAVSALIVWTAWDRGGGYYSTQLFATTTLLGFVILAACFSWRAATESLASESLASGASAGSWRDQLHFMQPPGLVMLAVVIWGGAFLQSRTMPAAVTETLNPGVHSIYSDWLSDGVLKEASAFEGDVLPVMPDPNAGVPLSVAPTYTRLALLMPAAFAVVCWLLFHCFRNFYAIIVFLAAISLSGVLFSFFGLVDSVRLAANQQTELRQFLLISPVDAGDPFGPFVNNNNAAGFLCLCLACTLGLWAVCEHLFQRNGADSQLSNVRIKSGLVLTRVIAVMMLVLLFAGILGSNSRGGFIGLVLGTIVLLAVFLRKANKIKVISMFIGIVALLCIVVSLIGFGERVRVRLATLFQTDLLEDPRMGHWADALVAAKYYFPSGAGLGTYRYAHLPFQENSKPYWFVNADGMPVEWLVEGGGWLMPLVMLLLFFLLRHVWLLGSRLRNEPSQSSSSDAVLHGVWVMSLFAIPSLLATQLFDFGITLLPLLMTFAGIAAAILRTSGLSAPRSRPPVASREAFRWRQGGGGVPAVALVHRFSGYLFVGWSCGALFMLVGELRVASNVEEATFAVKRERQAGLQEMDSQPARLEKLEQLSLQHPDNSMVWKGLAESRLVEQERLGELELRSMGREMPQLHQSWVARQNVRQVAHDKSNSFSFQQLLLPHQNADQWGQARQDFLRALLLSPLDDDVRVSLIELDMVTPEAYAASEELLTQAAALRPQHLKYINYLLWLARGHPGGAALESQKQRLNAEFQK